MSSVPAEVLCTAAEGHCITCGDEGIVMQVVSTGGAGALCRDPAHELHEVAVDLVGAVDAGDEVLVHAGVAIARLRTTHAGGDR